MNVHDKNLSQALIRAQAINEFVGDEVEKLQLCPSHRDRLAAGCLSISLTHHSSIAYLMNNLMFASACALLRPQMEAYIRGLWLFYAAIDEQIERVAEGIDPPKTRQMICTLEQAGHFNHGSLSELVNQTWTSLCDFTHTGIRVISRHIDQHQIGPVFSNEELAEVLNASNAWALLTSIGLAAFASNADLAERFHKFGIEIMQLTQ